MLHGEKTKSNLVGLDTCSSGQGTLHLLHPAASTFTSSERIRLEEKEQTKIEGITSIAEQILVSPKYIKMFKHFPQFPS